VKIAQVAPLYESVPPKLYGGTERIVSYLTEELVRSGHDVTLFASGDSVTRAQLVSACPRSLRLDPHAKDHLAHHLVLLEQVAERADEFDLIHYHVDYLHFPISRRLETAQVTTLHGRLDIPDLVPLYRKFRDMPVVSISDAQRDPLQWIHWVSTIYHGLPRDLYRFHEKPGGYLAFLGRISPEKGCDRAIEIARRSGRELRIAAKVDEKDKAYFEEIVRPLLREPGIEFVGEISDGQKEEFLGNARALIFPIDWPEPFGLVMIEALACGTPVLARRAGSVPEVLEDGVTGFMGDDADDLVRAVDRIDDLDRRACRRAFEDRFSDERMTRDYLEIYQRLLREPVTWKR
jgi:glycosyltransferase involved in cell wall biosynthesis